MLWRPVTNGEELFLRIHECTGAVLELGLPSDDYLDCLLSADDFKDFVRLSATLEVFLRCVRDARAHLIQSPGDSSASVAKKLRQRLNLPMRLWQDREFVELVRLVGLTSNQKQRNSVIEDEAMAQLAARCYLCGIPLSRKRKRSDSYTIEHVWPISFGGDTTIENLLPACGSCNSKRGHVLSWAAGPVQSTYVHPSEKIPYLLKLSFGMARLFHAAKSGRRLKTLKDAAISCQPLIVDLPLDPDRHHLYFELLPKVRSL